MEAKRSRRATTKFKNTLDPQVHKLLIDAIDLGVIYINRNGAVVVQGSAGAKWCHFDKDDPTNIELFLIDQQSRR